MRLLAILVLAPAAAILLCLAVVTALPGPLRLRLLGAVVILPILWPAFMFFVYWPARAWVPAASLAAVAVASGVVLVHG